MNSGKNIFAVTAVVTLAFCLFYGFSVTAQTPADAQKAREQLNFLKDKRKIYVYTDSEQSAVEDYLIKTGRFEVVRNSKDAEIVYVSAAARKKNRSGPAVGDARTKRNLFRPDLSNSAENVVGNAPVDTGEYSQLLETMASVFSESVYHDKTISYKKPLWTRRMYTFIEPERNKPGTYSTRKEKLSLVRSFVSAIEKLK